MVMRLQKSMRSLHEMCHTKYSDKIFPFDVECSRSDEVEKMVIYTISLRFDGDKFII